MRVDGGERLPLKGDPSISRAGGAHSLHTAAHGAEWVRRDAGLSLADTADPEPGLDKVLVGVRHVSLNSGELHFDTLPDAGVGRVHGWDASGVVLRPAADGTGHGGAWAQRRAVPVAELAPVPGGVDLAAAASAGSPSSSPR
ncbi:hypothetical protein [Streptomyces roseirectus]|uniref:hypothetical protein n=1 Tax=Streptomyces roseirectus TaxID=2768066 RepID=UPI001FE5AC86|nr:hypothetical protein [Streptomyces roseirectus]